MNKERIRAIAFGVVIAMLLVGLAYIEYRIGYAAGYSYLAKQTGQECSGEVGEVASGNACVHYQLDNGEGLTLTVVRVDDSRGGYKFLYSTDRDTLHALKGHAGTDDTVNVWWTTDSPDEFHLNDSA